MKNGKLTALLLMGLLALPAIDAQATGEQDNCNLITQAAQNAQQVEVNRITTIEQNVASNVATVRSCMEVFSQVAAHITMILGGFDVSPVVNTMFQNACNVIPSNIPPINQLTSGYTPGPTALLTQGSNYVGSQVSGGATRLTSSATSAITSATQQLNATSPPSAPGVLDQIACRLFNRC